MSKSDKLLLHVVRCTIEKVPSVNVGKGNEIRYIVNLSLIPDELYALAGVLGTKVGECSDIQQYVLNAATRVGIKIR